MPSTPSRFSKPHRDVGLLSQKVDVWRLKFDEVNDELEIPESWLSHDEIERASTFHFEKDRKRYILGRGGLRKLLADYLNQKPKEIEFSYSKYGKPELSASNSDQKITFNVAHSNNLAIFGFAREVAVGVDVEWERPLKDMRLIAKRFFAPTEFNAWEEVGEASKEHAFYVTWTRKEAFIKAIGEGLSYPLDRFVVTVEPTQAPQLISIDNEPLPAQDWTIHDLQVGVGYSAALAIVGEGYSVRCWHFTREHLVNHLDGD